MSTEDQKKELAKTLIKLSLLSLKGVFRTHLVEEKVNSKTPKTFSNDEKKEVDKLIKKANTLIELDYVAYEDRVVLKRNLNKILLNGHKELK